MNFSGNFTFQSALINDTDLGPQADKQVRSLYLFFNKQQVHHTTNAKNKKAKPIEYFLF